MTIAQIDPAIGRLVPARLVRQGIALTAIGLVLAGCAVGPNYARPTAPAAVAFKEAEGWTQAQPADAAVRGQWWTLFNDPVLNELEAKVEVSNQNLIAAEAAYRQARAILDQQRATIFPTVSLTGSATRSKSASSAVATGTTASTAGRTINQYTARLGATWDVDVWGRIRRSIEAARDTAQASNADLANAKLSAQVLLAVDYIQLRATDEQKRLIDLTVKGYADNLRIAQNRYDVGVGARSDVLTAQTQLKSAQASAVDLLRTRAQFEHAIAVLTGQAPANLSLTQTTWTLTVPPVPVGMPSTLLERRPDIAGAERRMAAANAQIGVNIAGYFPDISLSGSDGLSSSTLSRFFSAANNSWSLGANLAQTIFDAGATSARVRAARAVYDQQVANYRQTVLTAFQQVEDNIAALRVLEAEYELDLAASQNADEAEKIVGNQYQAGQVDFTTLVVAQNTALTARRTLIQTAGSRMVTLTDLISALGGGWQHSELAQK
ncbi:MAG: efflux system outer rane lipoprotein NodT family [Caulobacteraceae bacterium]|nr:efflux system outer rane lipoprotein NodT family [Caulobacteraceae bacterium]